MYQALVLVGPRLRPDLIHWSKYLDLHELERYFHIGEHVVDFKRRSVLSVVKSNWDYLCGRGVLSPVLDFKFCVDTRDFTPVCCRQPSYGIHEGKLINQHIKALHESGMITDCTSPYGSFLLLAARLYQEDCIDIDNLILKLCVNY